MEKEKRKEGKVPTSLNGTTRVSRQTIGKGQQGTVHEHDPQKRRGCRNMGKGHGIAMMGPNRWDGRAWVIAMGKP